MRKLMKHALLCIALMEMACPTKAHILSCQVAQTENPAKKEMPNPEKAARRMTDEMQKSLGLTDKQYKKIYKLNLKEQKARVEQMSGNGADGNRPPMMGTEVRPPMMGEAFGGGFPPMGGNGGPGIPPSFSGNKNDMRTLMEKKEKQMKKILTEEQYAKWQSEQPRPGRGEMKFPARPEKAE